MKTIAEIADIITGELDMDRAAAVEIATTYAAQLGYDAPEGGQAPGLEVSEDDAETIISAVTVAVEEVSPILDDLAGAASLLRRRDTDTDSAKIDRDDLVRKAVAAGISVMQIVGATGLSRERIYQIRDRRR